MTGHITTKEAERIAAALELWQTSGLDGEAAAAIRALAAERDALIMTLSHYAEASTRQPPRQLGEEDK